MGFIEVNIETVPERINLNNDLKCLRKKRGLRHYAQEQHIHLWMTHAIRWIFLPVKFLSRLSYGIVVN